MTADAPLRDDAAERHRLARSQREATPSPLLSALAATAPDAMKAPEDTREQAVRAAPRPAKAPAAAAPVPPQRNAMATGPASDGDGWRPLIDPRMIVDGVRRSGWPILGFMIAGALIGIGFALSTPKRYTSVAELLVDPRDIKIVERDVMQGGLPSDATLAIVENQVRVLTSGTVLNKVVDRLNLQNDPEFNGEAEGFGLRDLMAELRALLSGSDDGGDDMRRALAIGNLAESLEVERGGKTFVVSVAATTQSADKSATIANTVTDVFLQTYGDIQSGTAGRASDELTARLAELQSGLEEAERKVEAYKAENDLIDAQGRLITDDEVVKLNDQLSTARARTIELNARAASTRNISVDAVLGGDLPEQIASPVMAELRTQYATLKQDNDRLATRLGPRHPERVASEAQLEGARAGLAGELRRIVSSIQVELKRAVQLEQDLAARLAQLKARQGEVSGDLVTLRELEREATAKRAVYESFLLRARETGEQRGINTANVSVISVAQPPLQPVGPSRTTTVIASTLMGLFAGIGFGGLRGAFDSLRGDLPPRRRRPSSRRNVEAKRKPLPDDIDRIMQTAAARAATGNRAEGPAAAQPTPAPVTAADTDKSAATSPVQSHEQPQEDLMHANNPYAYAPQFEPQVAPMQAWQDPNVAAWNAHQEAMRQHAMNMAALQQATWHDLAMRAGYASPQQPMLYPQAGWPQPPQAQQPGQYAAPQPAPYGAYPAGARQAPPAWPQQPQTPQRTQAPLQPEVQAEPARQTQGRTEISPLDEIRESLREFREAVRDLAERRARLQDY